jgi:hypothetical protein
VQKAAKAAKTAEGAWWAELFDFLKKRDEFKLEATFELEPPSILERRKEILEREKERIAEKMRKAAQLWEEYADARVKEMYDKMRAVGDEAIVLCTKLQGEAAEARRDAREAEEVAEAAIRKCGEWRQLVNEIQMRQLDDQLQRGERIWSESCERSACVV